MKPNPEQDADRAAFEKWYIDKYVGYLKPNWRELKHYSESFELWQTAKADSRAMQDAFEQVCGALEVADKGLKGVNYSGFYTICDNDAIDDGEVAIAKALRLAAPFRKTGV